MITVTDVINIPYNKALEEIIDFTRDYFSSSGARRVVMGLSGGLDSSVLLVVLAKAISCDKITVIIMPDTRATPIEDTNDAIELARRLGVEYYVFSIDKIVDSYGISPFIEIDEDLPTGNLRARVRMTILYYYANKFNAIVAGSSDRSEILIGYYTKYGDGGADFLPIGCLYKTQVRELGKKLGLPEEILNKPSAPRLWRGHTAQNELGYSYEEIDVALYTVFDLGLSVDEAIVNTGLPRELFEKVLQLHRRSRHKRTTPPIPRLQWLKTPTKEI